MAPNKRRARGGTRVVCAWRPPRRRVALHPGRGAPVLPGGGCASLTLGELRGGPHDYWLALDDDGGAGWARLHVEVWTPAEEPDSATATRAWVVTAHRVDPETGADLGGDEPVATARRNPAERWPRVTCPDTGRRFWVCGVADAVVPAGAYRLRVACPALAGKYALAVGDALPPADAAAFARLEAAERSGFFANGRLDARALADEADEAGGVTLVDEARRPAPVIVGRAALVALVLILLLLLFVLVLGGKS